MLGRRIAARPRPPDTVRNLEIALLEEWNSIPQSLIDNLIASMANRDDLRAPIAQHKNILQNILPVLIQKTLKYATIADKV
ncbi:hypothetical protein TNCV_4855601 [Trichonephila clavipes]|nr:hypothetical protein TNCV_4855601 [Trichonephila clavipes]